MSARFRNQQLHEPNGRPTTHLRPSKSETAGQRIVLREVTPAQLVSRGAFGNVRPLRKRPTLYDVAKICGVSPATVSRVLNNNKKFSTTAAVRERIMLTARELGYVPDLSARNLSRGETHIVGLFASPQVRLHAGINGSLIQGISEGLHAGGYDVFLELPSDSEDKPLPFWRFDGAVLMQRPKTSTIAELDRRRVPYVCVNERVGNPVSQVVSDDAGGMSRALDHLHQLGHRKIAYANAVAHYFKHYSVATRYETILSGAHARNMKIVPGHEAPFESGADFLKSAVIASAATAVITYDHHIAIKLISAAAALGLSIPDNFSMICFNDVYPVSELVPPLTAVAVSGYEMGRIGGVLLVNHLATPQKPIEREIVVPEELVIRASTARPPNL
jgi:LacI family transcriptional regulator